MILKYKFEAGCWIGHAFFRKCLALFIAKKAESSDPSQLLIRQLFHCSKQSPLNPPCWQVTPPQAAGPAQHLRICRPHAVLPGSSSGRTVPGGQSEWERFGEKRRKRRRAQKGECQRPDKIRSSAQRRSQHGSAGFHLISHRKHFE